MSSQFAKLNVVWFALGVVIGITPSFLTPRQQVQTNANADPLVVTCVVNSTVDVVCPKCPDAPKCPEPPPCKQEPQKECPQIGRDGCTNVPIKSCADFSITDGRLSHKPDLCTYINLSCRSANHQFGTTAAQPQGMMAMGHGDLMFMDFISARYPHLANFTELGTAAGITTFYFGVTARLRGGTVHTFDYRDIRNPSARTAWLDNMLFFQEDVLNSVNPKVVEALSRSTQIALLDNGNKAKETNMYIQYLPVGSVMITHDWGTEIFWKDIVEEINNRGFEKLHEDFAEYFGSHVRAFIRTSKGKQ